MYLIDLIQQKRSNTLSATTSWASDSIKSTALRRLFFVYFLQNDPCYFGKGKEFEEDLSKLQLIQRREMIEDERHN